MKINQLSMAILSVVALTACGGGSSNNPPSEITISSFGNSVLKGGIIAKVVPKGQGSSTITAGTADNNSDINAIMVDGKTYHIPAQGTGDWDKVYTDRSMQYARFALLKKENHFEDFYQGFPTKEMPRNGTAKYRGTAGSLNRNNGEMSQLQSRFDVNFGDNTLTGKLFNEKQKIDLAANITGNTFAGEKGEYITQGGFYGPNAVELAGVYRNKNHTIVGAYGATEVSHLVTTQADTSTAEEVFNKEGGIAAPSNGGNNAELIPPEGGW